MYYRPIIASLAFAAVAVFAGIAFANEHEASATQEEKGATATDHEAAVDSQQQEALRGEAKLLKASEASGLEVRNKQNEDVGEVSEFVIDTKQGAITHLVISSGGFLGIGNDLLPVPIAAVDFRPSTDDADEMVATIDLAQDAKDKALVVREDDLLTKLGDAHWSRELARHYHVNANAQLKDLSQGELKRSSELIGKTVMRPNSDEDLGELNDIVFDADNGKIRYAALSFGGFLDIGDKLFAIPWDALTFAPSPDDASETRLSLATDVSEDRLERMQGFNQDNWPQQADMRWAPGTERSAKRPQSSTVE